MPRQTKRKATPSNTGVEPRHHYRPNDFVKDESWKQTFPQIDPLIPVTLDHGTFIWLWDFVSRKGRQADATNFHFSDIHKDVYQRAADQFANAAKEAFGEAYRVDGTETEAEVPSEASVEPSKPRRRRKRPSATVEKFEAAEATVAAIKTRRRRKPRSKPAS